MPLFKKSSGWGAGLQSTDILGMYSHSVLRSNAENVVVNKPRVALPAENSHLPAQVAAQKSNLARQNLLKFSRNARMLNADANLSMRELTDVLFYLRCEDSGGVIDLKSEVEGLLANGDTEEDVNGAKRLLFSLAYATKTLPESSRAEIACEALKCLHEIDLIGVLRDQAKFPIRPNGEAYPAKVANATWAAAYALGTNDLGLETLQKIANVTGCERDPKTINAITRKLRNFLNSAHLLNVECGQRYAAPHQLLQYASTDSSSLASRAYKADFLMITEPDLTWAELSETNSQFRTCRSHPTWAYASSAVRNGFAVDDAGSDISKACERSRKMQSAWIPRAIQRHNHPSFKYTIGDALMPFKNKSPLTALFNCEDVKQRHCVSESEAVKIVFDQLSSIGHQLCCQYIHVLSREGGEPGLVLSTKEKLIDTLIKVAILDTWNTERGLRQRYQGRPIQEHERAAVEKKLESLEDDLCPHEAGINANGEADRDVTGKLSRGELSVAFSSLMQENSLLAPIADVLNTWAQEMLMACAAHEMRDSSDAVGSFDESIVSLRAALARMNGDVDPVGLAGYLDENKRLDTKGVADFLCETSKDMALGSKISTSARGTVGLDSQNFLTVTSKKTLFSAQPWTVPVTAGIKFSPSYSRDGTVSLSLPAEGVNLELITRQKGVVTLGVSAFAGMHLSDEMGNNQNLGVTVGVGAGGYAKFEMEKKIGACIRLGRAGKIEEAGGIARLAGLAGDTQLKKDFSPLLRVAVEGMNEQDELAGLSSPLHKILSMSDEVSVTYLGKNDYREKTVSLGGTFSIGATANFDNYRAGPGASLNVEMSRQPQSWQEYTERTGKTRIERATSVQGFKVAAQFSLTGGEVNPLHDSDKFQSSGAGAVSANTSKDIYNRYVMVQRTLILDGSVITPASNFHYKHQTADGFAQSVLSQIDYWSHAELLNIIGNMSADSKRSIAMPRDWPAFPGAGQAYEFNSPDQSADPLHEVEEARKQQAFFDLLKEAKETIRQFIHNAQTFAQPNKTYSEWYQLDAGAARKISQHRSNAQFARLAGLDGFAKQEEILAGRMANDISLYNPILLFSIENQSELHSAGIPNFGLILKSGKGITVANLESMT